MAPGNPTQRAFRSVGRPLVAALAIGTVTFAAVPSAGSASSPVSSAAIGTAALSTATPAPTAYLPLPASAPVVVEPVVAASGAAPVAVPPLVTTTARPGTAARVAIDFALAQRGLPYVWGGDGPDAGEAGFDCSGLTTAAYAAAGITLPRTAHTQFYAGPHVPDGALLEPGDLVFYGVPARVHHVGLYLGDGLMVNAPTFGKPVQIAYVRYSGDDYLGATRPAAGRDTPGLLTTPDLPYTVPSVPEPDAPKAPTEFPAPAAPVPAPTTSAAAQAPSVLAAAENPSGSSEGEPSAPSTTPGSPTPGPTTAPTGSPGADTRSASATTAPTTTAPGTALPTTPSGTARPGVAAAGSPTSGASPTSSATVPATSATTSAVVPGPAAGSSPPSPTPPQPAPASSASVPAPAAPPSTSAAGGTGTTPPTTTPSAAPTQLLLPATGTALSLVAAGRDANGLPVASTAPTRGSLNWRPGTGRGWVAAVGLPAGLAAPAVGATLVVIGPGGTRTTLTVRSRTTSDAAAAKAAVNTVGKGPRLVLVRTDPATGQVLVVVAT